MNLDKKTVVIGSIVTISGALAALYLAARLYSRHPALAVSIATPAVIFLLAQGPENLRHLGILPRPPARVTPA
jgi:hypothetical protein